MSARLERTDTPGIYKRGKRFVATVHVPGVGTRKKSFGTKTAAKRWRKLRLGQIESGEYQDQSRVRFREYAEEWVERYQGRGRSGFREHTRADYRRDLQRYAIPYFDGELGRRLTEIKPRDVANWIAWLCDERAQGERLMRERLQGPERTLKGGSKVRIPGEYAAVDRSGRTLKRTARVRPAGRLPALEGEAEHGWRLTTPLYPLADATVRRIVAPLRACLSTARQEGLIRDNPAHGIALPHRAAPDEEPENRRAFTREQLEAVLTVAPARHRAFFRFLAATGLRWSEAIAVQWADLQLDGSHPHVRVRRSRVRKDTGAPKSRTSRRDVPLGRDLVDEFRRRRGEHGGEDDDLVFPNRAGGYLDHSNMMRKVLKPMLEEADANWRGAGFHTFRHTCASMLFERGANAVKVQRWLGHSSPAVTLNTYLHLLDDRIDDPLDLGAELGGVVSAVVMDKGGTTEKEAGEPMAGTMGFSAR